MIEFLPLIVGLSDIALLTLSFLVVLIGLYALGVPVAYAIGLTSLVIMILPFGPGLMIESFIQRMYAGIDQFILLAIPFFLFAGRIMNEIGMTDDIFDFSEELVGPIPGGLGHVNIVVSMIFSGMSGAAVADAAGLGTIEFKAMTDRGYPPRFAAGITAASSTIGPIIPPSIPMIVYGVMAQVSIGALFIAGIIPGLLMGVSLMVTVAIIMIRSGEAQRNPYNLKRLFVTFGYALPALVAPIIIVGGILVGLFTPTESAVVASIYALFLGGLYYRSMGWKSLYNVLRLTFVDTASLLIIISLASHYGFLLTVTGVPNYLADIVVNITTSTTITLLLIVGVLLILGTFMETLAIILIITPILAPLFPDLGIDPLAFGIVMMVTLMIGLISPPFGVVLFVLERVTNLDLEDVMIGVLPFYIPLLVVLLLVIFFPDLALALPRRFGFWS